MSGPATDRRLLIAAGGLALAGGLATAWWWRRPSGAAGEAGADTSVELPPGFWDLAFARPEGGQLALAGLRGKPLLVNFWATWCPPCIREMPHLDRFAKQFAPNGLQVVGVAADQDKPVRDFLGQHPVSYPIALAGFEGIALSRSLGNSAGALPFTVMLDAQGRVSRRHLGETEFEQLVAWATSK